MISREKAVEILNRHLKNRNLFRHCLAVEAAMKGLAEYFNEDKEKWGIVGLLHDGDWEETKNNPQLHTIKMVEWLKEEKEEDKEILRAIFSHNFAHNGQNQPQSKIEWALYTCDELTGLIFATALVMPNRKLALVTVESVLKKFPSKSFAAGVNREQIKMCQEKLGLPLDKFIEIVLRAMKKISYQLGL